MLMPRIIPCLDVRAGRVVKGVRFAGLRDRGDPASLAAEYERQGADELVMLDVAATVEQRLAALGTVRALRDVLSIPLTVGGGVDDLARAASLLEAGADKIAVNTAAVVDPGLIGDLAARFGSQCIVIAIDAARDGGLQGGVTSSSPSRWSVVTHAGRTRTALDAVEWAARATGLGAGEVLLTGLDRDGTRAGYDLELMAAVCRAVTTPVIASGGADGPAHLLEALRAGADAALAASIFHEAQYTVADVKLYLVGHGIPVRVAPPECPRHSEQP